VAHDGIAALAISLPFSCILGLFSSLTTTSMGMSAIQKFEHHIIAKLDSVVMDP